MVFLTREFPQVFKDGGSVSIEKLAWAEARMRLRADDEHLRPGDTISGPAMMMMADCAAYICTLSVIGEVALAVTTNLNINFLRKPPKADLICVATPLKIGKSLFVSEARLFGADDRQEKLVAHATATYSIPPSG